jgi:hypothetical protein
MAGGSIVWNREFENHSRVSALKNIRAVEAGGDFPL